jgi:RNA polymerase sigma-70 factor (ECF subfamily)
VTQEEFRALFASMFPALSRYARRSLDSATADEVAAEAMYAIWAKRPPSPTNDHERRRLLALCYRICDGYIRNAQRAERRRHSLGELLAAQASPENQVLPDVAEGVAARARVEAVLGRLPKGQREAVLLILAGHTVSEIAVILQCGERAATMRVHRARKHLRKQLEQDREGVQVASDTG